MSTAGGYHDECGEMGDIMSTPGDVQYTGSPYKFNCFPKGLPPHLS